MAGRFYCGENEIQASLISSASGGATPTPATSLCPRWSGGRRLPRRSSRSEGGPDTANKRASARRANFGEVIRLPDCKSGVVKRSWKRRAGALPALPTSLRPLHTGGRSEEHTSELQSHSDLVCRLLLE